MSKCDLSNLVIKSCGYLIIGKSLKTSLKEQRLHTFFSPKLYKQWYVYKIITDTEKFIQNEPHTT